MTAAHTPAVPPSGNIARPVLENGITVLVYENFAAQSVVISGSLRAGARLEDAQHNGLAALTASALTRGTANRDFGQIASTLEDIGADLSLGAGAHRASLYGKARAEDLPTLLDVLNDVLRNPSFPAAQVERLRGEVLTGLQIRNQDTRYRANRAFYEALYPEGHPYHYSVRGSIDSVRGLALADLQAFHAQHYGPQGMLLVICGAVRADQALEQVRAFLGDWRNPHQPAPAALPDLPPLSAPKRSAVALAGKTQSDFVMGVAGPSRFASDYLAAMLVNSVLGQFGMMGRIGASVREDLGLAYYAYSQLEGGLGPGPWSIAAGVNPANLELAIARSVDELRRLVSEPVSAGDLADNQSYVIGRIPLQLESNEGLVGSILNMELYQLGLDHLLQLPGRIRSLTPDDLLAAAQHYLDPEKLVIGVAGPPA